MPVRALNLYYARDEGVREQVLATRLRATDVRQRIGVARGRVFVRANGLAELPDVLWDCPFRDAGAHDVDMQARAASAEFEACRAIMRTLTRRFERVIYDEIDAFAASEVGVGECMMQLWLGGVPKPDLAALRALSATTVLRRCDDNARLPDWIAEIADHGDRTKHALEHWIACDSTLDASTVRWQRVA